MANNEQNDTIIRKIQKLLALANNNPNEQEAASATARVQQLLADYNLELAMVTEARVAGATTATSEAEEKREKTRISRSAQYKWQRKLWKTIAESNFCFYWVAEVFEGKRGTKSTTSKVRVKRHMVLGRESNVMSVRILGEYLEDTIERMLPFPNSERLSRSANSWKEGAVDRLCSRIVAKTEEIKRASEAARSSNNCTGLVLADVHQREYEANYDAQYGSGAWARKVAREAEWQKQYEEERNKEAVIVAPLVETEKERLARIKREEAEAEKSRKYWQKKREQWRRQEEKERAKRDEGAYWSGYEKADDIKPLGSGEREQHQEDELGGKRRPGKPASFLIKETQMRNVNIAMGTDKLKLGRRGAEWSLTGIGASKYFPTEERARHWAKINDYKVVGKPEAELHNHTGMTIDAINALPLLGTYRNEWRNRSVSLYRLADGEVISVGTTFDGSMIVIAKETDADHAPALAAWALGNRSYVAK